MGSSYFPPTRDYYYRLGYLQRNVRTMNVSKGSIPAYKQGMQDGLNNLQQDLINSYTLPRR